MNESPPTSPSHISRRSEQATAAGISKRGWLILGGGALVLLCVGLWTYHAVEKTLTDHLTSVLNSTLDANIEALHVVIENERSYIQAWAKDIEVRTLTEQLLSGKDTEKSIATLNKTLTNVVNEEGYLGFAIIDAQGVIRATDQQDSYLGKRLTPYAMEMLGSVIEKESAFKKPFAKNALVESETPISNKAIMLTKAPIRGLNDDIIATLVFSINPEKDFTRILSVAQIGQTGNTYAFDDRGLMLSESRYEEQLKELGLIPDTPEGTAILTLQLRDPGVDLTSGAKPKVPRESWPLTQMAASAKSGKKGLNIDGYRDYRGVKVAGAWQWLPEYGFGVVTEVERSEALRSLRPVRLAFIGLLGLLILTASGFTFTGRILSRLKSQVMELRELGKYKLVELIGSGGMGKVYKASHAILRRPTAIKLIHENQMSEKNLARFEQEVQITSQLTHPNTILVYDYGHTPDGVFYYAMEYLTGITLGQMVKIEKRLPPARTIYIMTQILGSLTEAHEKNLIHRDIKPGNIMLCQRGGNYDFVKVLDFGLVGKIEPTQATEPQSFQGIMGSPGFIAPELLVTDKEVDARSDLYSVGALGYLMLTGQMVFAGDGIQETLYKTVNVDPPRPSVLCGAVIPQELDDLIHSCLARSAEDRPASASAIIERLIGIDLRERWTNKEAQGWWQENATRIRLERKLHRPESATMSETVMDIDLEEPPST